SRRALLLSRIGVRANARASRAARGMPSQSTLDDSGKSEQAIALASAHDSFPLASLGLLVRTPSTCREKAGAGNRDHDGARHRDDDGAGDGHRPSSAGHRDDRHDRYERYGRDRHGFDRYSHNDHNWRHDKLLAGH